MTKILTGSEGPSEGSQGAAGKYRRRLEPCKNRSDPPVAPFSTGKSGRKSPQLKELGQFSNPSLD